MTTPKNLVLIGGTAASLLIVAGISGFLYFSNICSPAPVKEFSQGSQGYRVWAGPTLQTFEHGNKKICIPEGWHAIGATQSGSTWAKFAPKLTGVLIRDSGFASTTLEFQNSSYVVTVYYPGSEVTPLTERYLDSIRNAFERNGAIFGDSHKNPPRPHTVLITPGIEGTTSAEGPTSVYPDPGPDLSIYVQSVDTPRGDELFIHAVTHIYNRFRPDLLSYQNAQTPIAANDWQELEAVWAETAFHTQGTARKQRLEYLYTVHTAVQTHDFTLVHSEPFDDQAAFNKIKPTVVLDDSSTYVDAQYGHYVLGALAMVATEGLLKKYDTKTDLERILLNIHKDPSKNFFAELEKVLPHAEVENVWGWMLKGQTIPKELVFSAYP